MAQLPDLHVSDSSEAMLSGRKPPFRLLVKCVHSDGRRLNIRHAVSEGFVVRALCKKCIQKLTEVSVLPHFQGYKFLSVVHVEGPVRLSVRAR